MALHVSTARLRWWDRDVQRFRPHEDRVLRRTAIRYVLLILPAVKDFDFDFFTIAHTYDV